jgi:predicted TIM-barrel fold metal-dependent hydrolase
MIIDVHGHLGNINPAPFWSAGAEKLEACCAAAGVDVLCVSSAKSLMYDAHEGNVELDQALRSSQRLLGYVVVNPVFPESIRDLSLLQTNTKFRGVKVHPDYHGYDLASKRAVDFLDAVAERTPLMLFHVSCMPGTGLAAASRVVRFAERHPGTTIIMAHVAGMYQNGNYPYFPNLQGLEETALAGLANVFIDTAHYLTYVYPGVIERMVELAGAERLVFGTDVPLQGPLQMRFALDAVRAAMIPDDAKARILYRNAAKLLRVATAE